MRMALHILLLLLFAGSPAGASLRKKCDRVADLGRASYTTGEGPALQAPQALQPEHLSETIAHRAKAVNDRLEPYTDPFAAATTYEQAELIFQLLAVRPLPRGGNAVFHDVEGKETHDTPAQQLRELLNRNIGSRELKYDPRIMALVLKDVEEVLADQNATRRTLHSAALSLRLAHEYARRFAPKRETVDRDGKPAEKKEEKKPEEKKKKEQGKPEQPQKFEQPKLPKSYKPTTKDTKKNQGDGQQQQKHVAVEFSGVAKRMKMYDFNSVVRGAKEPFMPMPLPGSHTNVPPFEDTHEFLIVHNDGSNQFEVMHPSGYELLQPADPKAQLTRSPDGEYVLHTDLPEVRIPVRRIRGEHLSPEAVEALKRPVGITEAELPPQLLAFVRRLKGRSPLEIASQVEKYFQEEYLYSVGPRPETDIIDALKSPAFQCDMAAFAMVAILRDVFHIPCRAVGGMRTKPKREGGKLSSVVEVPGEGHAWVEVYHDGEWREFDPTPKKKDQKEENKGSPEEAWNEENQQHQDQQNQQDQQDQGQRSQSGPQRPEEEQGKKKGKPGEEEQEGKKDKDKEGKGKKGKHDERGETERQRENEELADRLEIGSLSLSGKRNTNPFLERFGRVLLRQALDPNGQRSANIEALHRLIQFFRDTNLNQLEDLARDAIELLQGLPGDSLDSALTAIRLKHDQQDVNTTYQQLHQMIGYLELYQKTLDPSGPLQGPTQLLRTLREARAQLEKLSHPDAARIALVNDFIQSLPPISQSIIREKYGLKTVGPNNETHKIANDLMSGKLRDYMLIAELAPMADFILDSSPEAQYRPVKTVQEDSRYPRGNDLVPTTNLLEAHRALRMQPHLSPVENLRQGTLYSPKRKRRVNIPDPTGKVDEQERITIVAYDTSGSMNGNPGDFQAALIAAFVDKALSDVSEAGNHRHKAMLLGFDTEVHKKTPVSSGREAKNIIRNYRQEMKNSNGGTDIQKALIQSLAAIAEAQKRNGEPLKKANIVLMTDGQSSIDLEALRQARAAIDRRTPVQVMLISINGNNPELTQFAIESGQAGFDAGFSRVYEGSDISKHIDAANHPPVPNKEDAFFSTKKPEDIPPAFLNLMRSASDQATTYLGHVIGNSRTQTPSTWYRNLETLRPPDQDKADRPIEAWISSLRGLVFTQPIFKDKRLTNVAVHDLLQNWARLSGVRLEDLTQYELEQLRHLLKEVGGVGP